MNTIAIIGAMPSELADIRRILGQGEVKRISGFEFHVNEYKGKKLVSVCCGIAKVNAAVCTQVMIDNFAPECVINCGMNSDVKVCDIVVSDEVLPHDLDLHFLQDYPPYCGIFKADARIIEKTKELCAQRSMNCFTGRIVSGEAFISDSKIKAEIQQKFNPYAVDMESAAVGHCCFLNEMPFASVRCISDNADDEGAMSFDEFEKIAAKIVAELVLDMSAQL